MTCHLRYTAASDVGLVRKNNEDSAYAGPHLAAVADGVGGNVAGEVASAATISILATIDREFPVDNMAGVLRATIENADETIRGLIEAEPALSGMGTTLTALLYSDGMFCLGHVGDSRAYRLRDGEFVQMSRDHTFVQTLVDEGRITREEATVHPQRSLIMQSVNGCGDIRPDLELHDARLGDRWLLCSDGLTDYVALDAIEDAVTSTEDVDELAARLVILANAGGGIDNVACVIADVVGTAPDDQRPVIVGAAHEPPDELVGRAADIFTPVPHRVGAIPPGPVFPRARFDDRSLARGTAGLAGSLIGPGGYGRTPDGDPSQPPASAPTGKAEPALPR